MKKLILFIALMQFALAFSQKQGNIWYFGNKAGVDFNGPEPVALLDSKITSSEGSASVADANGNLLFYTDGVKVYNKDHLVMPNGHGLLGSTSTTQLVVVPKPGSETIYYIFTAGAGEEEPLTGLNYTEVDMAGNNGLGIVTQNKNIHLQDDTGEQLAATFHRNGTDIWVISKNGESGEFFSFLITPNGVTTQAVTSNSSISSFSGYMKASPDSSKIALSNMIAIYMLDFDNQTGLLSNEVALSSEWNFYGLEFSASGKKMYLSKYYSAYVVQFDLEAEDIAASEVTVLDDSSYFGGALQRAADGKIYMVNSAETSLSVINNPEITGLGCNVVPHAVDLGGRSGVIGLPFNIWPSQLAIQVQGLCEGANATFSFTADIAYDSILWDFGDGTTSTQPNPVHAYAAGGTYTVTFTAFKPGTERVLQQQIVITPLPQFNLPETYTACVASTVTIATEALNFDHAAAIYQWEFNSQPIAGNTASIQATGFGMYTVTVTVNGCSFTKSTTVVKDTFAVTFTEGCLDNLYNLSVLPTDNSFNAATATYAWQGANGLTATQQQITIDALGDYTVTVTTPDGCTATQTYTITTLCPELPVDPEPPVDPIVPFIPKGISPNNDGKNDEFDLTGLDVTKLAVFNRYGQEVYTRANYVAQWYGQTNSGDDLPTGTYYYVIHQPIGSPKTGWVYINRQN